MGTIVVTCNPRISEILAKEITSLGLTVTSIDAKGVITEGTFEDTWYLNLNLRTGNKVLWEIDSFDVGNADELYEKSTAVKWDEQFSIDKLFSIESYVRNDSIRDNRFANLKLKDSIADFFKNKHGKRPNSGKEKSEVVIFLYWVDNKATLYYNTSGETISKHGYRTEIIMAPMVESLASAILMSGNWDMNSPVVNPMCGSGTIAIEAALLALNRSPGHFRDNFSFMHHMKYNPRKWKELKAEARNIERNSLGFPIIATDHDEEAILAARENAGAAGVSHLIKFQVCDFTETQIPKQKGIVIFNPEYGERLGELSKLEETYKQIGDFMKQKCAGYLGYVFTGNLDLAKKVGLKANRKMEFYNGKIDCRLLEYDLFEGSRE